MLNDLAPIVLFVYNRPQHTLQTLEALKKNELAGQSILYIFADGPKDSISEEQKEKITEVRLILRKEKWCGEVHIKEQTTNKGLANSIISGVTEIVNKHGKIIVLEDDLITSPYFLKYMNQSLFRFKNEEKVKQIAAYFPSTNLMKGNSFFLPVTTTWGWGTWKRVWEKIDFEAKDYTIIKTDKKLQRRFNLDDRIDYTRMLLTQMETEMISSWGIRFWWNIFKQNGLILYPDYSLISNIGFDVNATHTKTENYIYKTTIKTDYQVSVFPKKIQVCNKSYSIFLRKFNKKFSFSNLIKRIFNNND